MSRKAVSSVCTPLKAPTVSAANDSNLSANELHVGLRWWSLYPVGQQKEVHTTAAAQLRNTFSVPIAAQLAEMQVHPIPSRVGISWFLHWR